MKSMYFTYVGHLYFGLYCCFSENRILSFICGMWISRTSFAGFRLDFIGTVTKFFSQLMNLIPLLK